MRRTEGIYWHIPFVSVCLLTNYAELNFYDPEQATSLLSLLRSTMSSAMFKQPLRDQIHNINICWNCFVVGFGDFCKKNFWKCFLYDSLAHLAFLQVQPQSEITSETSLSFTNVIVFKISFQFAFKLQVPVNWMDRFLLLRECQNNCTDKFRRRLFFN